MDFDYAIVGGGSAGSVLANRLSARPGATVLLIEAGIDTPPGQVPADILDMFPSAALNPRYKWMKLLAYTQSLRRNDRAPIPILYDQGKVMGGGSSINFQAANRGAPADYDEWNALGAEGWAWGDVLPYFRKLEDDADFSGEFHGQGGPIPVQRMPRKDWSGYTEALAQSLDIAGLPYLEDQNGEYRDGYFAATQNNRNGRRVSAALAYLDAETRRRPGLQILSESHVMELLFEGLRAVGVRVKTKQGEQTIRAREIILSAGAVHSPAILLRSGIGPAAQLSDKGIEVRRDAPGVGENLRDHPGVTIMSYVVPAARVAVGQRPLQLSLRHSSNLEGCPPSDLYTGLYSRAGWHGVGRRLGAAVTWVNKPFSAGRVSLQTARWEDEPKVELNYFDDYRDLTRLMQSVRFVASLFDREPMQRAGRVAFGARWSPRARAASAVNWKNFAMMGAAGALMDGSATARDYLIRKQINEGPDLADILADDEVLEDFVRSTVMGIKHLSCTCRMGREDDPNAVTAPDGRVHGIERLRVADASIMPSLPRCNTNLTTMMIGEKISDAIIAA